MNYNGDSDVDNNNAVANDTDDGGMKQLQENQMDAICLCIDRLMEGERQIHHAVLQRKSKIYACDQNFRDLIPEINKENLIQNPTDIC